MYLGSRVVARLEFSAPPPPPPPPQTVEVERAKAERAVAAEMAELREQLCTLHEKLQKPDRPAPLLTPPPTVDRQQVQSGHRE